MGLFDGFLDDLLDITASLSGHCDEQSLADAVRQLQHTLDEASALTGDLVQARNRLIVEIYRQHRLSQTEIANLSGLAQTTVSKVIRNA